MLQLINLVKMIYNIVLNKETNNNIILNNILAYLILKKMVGNIFSSELYENIYDKTNNNSFISIIKKKYNLDIIILDINDIEKIITAETPESININNIIKELNKPKVINIEYNQYNNYMIDLIPNNDKLSILLLSSQSGEFNSIINNYNSNKIDIYDINNVNTTLSQMEYDYNYYSNNNNSSILFKNEDYIHNNIINKSYDIILCTFPLGLRNIIHADCCDKIKKLKIRGTKSEPLILQLIMMSLNNKGSAYILVPNTLLNNDSKQHIDTRNYLINNFNVLNIINCDNNLSILIFEKNGLTKQTTFSKIENNTIVKLFDISYDKLVKRNYNLYYEKYINTNININNNDTKKINDVVEVVDCINSINSINCNYLSIPKFFNDNKKVEIIFDNYPLDIDNISLKVKDNNIVNQKYFNYYFLYNISPLITTATTGKSRKLDLSLLLSMDINIPSINIQNKIVEYFDTNYYSINLIKKQIETMQQLKKTYIDTVCEKYSVIKLKELCDIDVKPDECTNQEILCVQRNSKSAGNTLYYNSTNYNSNSSGINTNLYYINNLRNISQSALYILLKHNEANLNKIASITTTINLSRTNLENFEIKNIPIEHQENMIKTINEYDNIIKSLSKNIELLINTNIFKLF